MTQTISLPLTPAACTGSNGVGILQSLELTRYIDRMIARRWIVSGGGCDYPTGGHNWLQIGPTAPPLAKRSVTAISFSLGSSTATVTVDGPNFYGGTDDVSGLTYIDPWLGVIATGGDSQRNVPTSWKFVFDHPLYGWSQCIECDITSWTNARVITIDAKPIRNAIKASLIPTAGWMIGWNAVIVGSGKFWRSDRVVEFPNDPQLATGVVESLAAVTGTASLPASPAPNVFRATGFNPLAANGRDLRGCDFLAYTTDGVLERATIAATSTASVAYLSGATWTATVGQPWAVVTNNARCYPGKFPMIPYWSDRGVQEQFNTYDFRTDDISAASMPVKTVKIEASDGVGGCTTIDFPAYGFAGLDPRTPYDDSDGADNHTCGRPYDHLYAPDVFKTWSGRQFATLALAGGGSFVEAGKDFTGQAVIPSLNVAETARIAAGFLASAATNTGATNLAQTIRVHTATTGNVVGTSGTSGASNSQIYVTGAGFTHDNLNVFYSIRQATGAYNGGYGTLSGSTLASVNGAAFTQASGTNDADLGDSSRTIIMWAGFTKNTRNCFRSMYDQPGFFKPDIVTPDVGDPFPQDPPAPVSYTNSGSFGVGSFIKHPRSTHCWDWTAVNADPLTVQGFAVEGTGSNTAFVTGQVYRWTGDGYWHPAIYYGGFSKGVDLLAPYIGKGWVGRLSDTHQSQRMALMSGTVSAGGNFWCRVPTCDFFNDPVTGGVLHTSTGTATAGSTTSFADSTVGNPTNPDSSFWASSRFTGFGGSYVSFPIEFDHGTGTMRGTFDPQFTEARLLATGATNATGTWTDALSSTANGLPWRIREPRLLHPVYGRTMHFAPGTNTGSPFTATNIGTCGDIQFFTGAGTNTVGPGWTSTIDYPVPGGVYKYNGTSAAQLWTVATGTDTARLGVITPRDFTKNPTFNLESFRVDNGPFDQGTVVSIELVNETWAMLMAMSAIRMNGSYTNKSSDADASPAINDVQATGHFAGTYDGSDPTNVQTWDGTTGTDSGPATTTFSYFNGTGYTAYYTGNDAYALNAAAWGLSPTYDSGGIQHRTTDGLAPRSSSSVTTDNSGCIVNTAAVASYIKATLPSACRDITSASLKGYVYGWIDSSDSAPIAGSCSGGLTTPISFKAANTSVLYHKWSQVTSGSASGTNAAYLGPVGSISLPEKPTMQACPSGNPSTPPSGGASGGWYAGDMTIIATYSITDV